MKVPDELEKAKAKQQSLQKSLDTTDTLLRQQESALSQKKGEFNQLVQRIGNGTLAEAQAEWKKLCDAIRKKKKRCRMWQTKTAGRNSIGRHASPFAADRR